MLPTEYLSGMRELLKDEYDDYLRSLEAEAYRALRLNPLKADEAQLLVLLNEYLGIDDAADRVPWEPLGYYYTDDKEAADKTDVDDKTEEAYKTDRAENPEGSGRSNNGNSRAFYRPGRNPFHEAGMYYIQEPSAMLPVAMLMKDENPVPEGSEDDESGKCEHILDLCAAPGGKSTQIASYMRGRGVLICNEIISSRAAILSENIERMGIRNALVLNESPQKLKDTYVDYFDRILVDAPCSGEGMFRKNEQAVKEWSPDNVLMCARRQDEILDCAATMLKPGGIMVYSTCTFSREEDEECIERFLDRHRDYELAEMEKLFPHRIKGEGHFAAKLIRISKVSTLGALNDNPGKLISKENKKKGRNTGNGGKNKNCGDGRKAFEQFCGDTLKHEAVNRLKGSLIRFGDNLYLMPQGAPGIDGIKVLRAGLWLGTLKKDRFEPSHALALALKPDETVNMVDITPERAAAFIEGMPLSYEQDNTDDKKSEMNKASSGLCRGWVLVCCRGITLGWGKAVGDTIKNHYPKGLRKRL